MLRQQAQRLPSGAPDAPQCRRLWYVRDADDFLRGRTGARGAAAASKQERRALLHHARHLERNAENTLGPPAHDDGARLLGDAVQVLHEDSTPDCRRPRWSNGSMGWRVPPPVLSATRTRYLRRGKPNPLPQRTRAAASRIVAQDQAEWRGGVQSDRLADHRHLLPQLQEGMAVSLVQTLAQQDQTTCRHISRRYGATLPTADGDRTVLRITIDRAPPQKPLTTHCGAVSLRGNNWGSIHDAPTKPVWRGRSAGVERLLAHTCARGGSPEHIAVHHVRKLAELASQGQANPPSWKRRMVARHRQSLVGCRSCHAQSQYGRYDGPSFRSTGSWRAS
jgi:hypothetical protein